ncbi:probable disease resistance protein At5g66900 [Cynara cardunculus var. scolymus]|uniref:Disease resistance protein n=1 Tax=Cynara cardunculus var. scolymus TaxID=59895 RepID=A0A118JRH4_CYNCS|nr:probable disease resistance protein At5g66900 [Cynara cardunculus var. scolymus]KVH87519.1 Disease resistance protein [Cynara cardunculus var. scolymus]
MDEAVAVAVGALAGDAVSKSSDAIIHVIKKCWQFRSKLTQTEETTKKRKQIFTDIEKQNNLSKEETDMYRNHLKEAEEIVQKGKNMKWYSFKRYRYSSELDDLKASSLRFCQIDVPLQGVRDTKEALVVVKDLKKGIESSGNWSSGVPLPKGDVIGSEDRVRALKAMVLKDSKVDDCSVVVVSAGGGYGKTTLVTELCHDPDIQEIFGRNIYFVTISEAPNIKLAVNNLLQKNHGGHKQLHFVTDEDATCQWGRFLGENKSEILLVLDDVWHESIVTDFKFKLRGYKILVTSRMTFTQFDTYELQLLNNQDATKLFRNSAFSVDGSERIDISDDLIKKLVKHCKNHPLALVVIGGLLKGKEVATWKWMLKILSAGEKSILDLHKSIPDCLERSLVVLEKEPAIRQCYLDLGLFPEDQRIAATMLMDMWVHLYNHDEEGLDTINKLTELSSRKLATRLRMRKQPAIANYCEEESVVQHDMMWRLANKLSSKEPVERLIIKADEQVPPQLPHTVNARILSISTDERFSMRWNDYQVRKVEVFVLNLMSKIYDLPQFVQNMEILKVLIVTNYGYYFSQLRNFPAPQYLSSLTRIRLEHVSISSISTSLPELVNLQKLSLIMCKIGNSFNECSMPNKFPSLLEIELESCEDLVTFPATLCNLVGLKKLSITNCLELISFSEGLGNLTNLEVLRLASCSKLMALPESVIELQKLSIIDLNYCLHLSLLPSRIGELGCLQIIHMIGCTGLDELPSSIKDSCSLEVVCDEEIFQKLWSHLPNVKVKLVEEDRFDIFWKIVARDMDVQ